MDMAGERNTAKGPVPRRAALRAVVGGALAGSAVIASPGIASAQRSGDDTFIVGTLATARPPKWAREALERALAKAVGRNVAVRHFHRGQRLVDASASGVVHCAVHTALTFATVSALCGCAVPILRPVASNGTAGVRATLIVRKGRGSGVVDLSGATILGAQRGTVIGEIARRGLTARFAEGMGPVFGTVEGEAATRFLDGAGDALIGYETVDLRGGKTGGTLDTFGSLAENAQVIWRSFPVWHGPIALSAKGGVTRSVGERLLEELIALPPRGAEMTGLGLGRVSMLVGAERKDYETLVNVLRNARA